LVSIDTKVLAAFDRLTFDVNPEGVSRAPT